MAKLFRSFRLRMIRLFGLSVLVSGAITYLIYKALQLYYHTTKLEDPSTKVRSFIRDVGDVNFFLLVFIPLSILFFFLLTKRYVAYFDQISGGIRRLANGDFNSRVAISSGDEFEDIAGDINQASEQLRQALERGDFAENSKDRLLLNLAHDLRTPLTSVLGYLNYILRDDHLTPEQVKHYSGIAYAKSRRLEKLIEELFEIARMNYGKLPMQLAPVDLSELLRQLIEELQPVFEKNNLTVRLTAAPLTIMGDGEMLVRVFENLLTNAVHYGKDGKYIDIRCIGCDSDTGHAVVQVVNYGDFIPADELPHIFDMFFTGDQARTYREGSTGLGLFIARNIVEQHRGSLTAKSDVVRTEFEVRLPPAEA